MGRKISAQGNMTNKIKTIGDVVSRQLCVGCGACAFAEPERFRMADAPDHGRRPFLRDDAIPESGDALSVCPGISLEHDFDRNSPSLDADLLDGWGPILSVWEGYAADPEIRLGGSSGGAATALALYCLEQEDVDSVVHTAASLTQPYMNATVVSKSKSDLMKTTGSRYAPASPCDGLSKILFSEKKGVFIGKPCDVAAVRKAEKLRPDLKEKLALTIGFFCAGVPSTQGNLALAQRMKAPTPEAITSLRYRGNGWPGLWRMEYKTADGQTGHGELTYAESWGYLQQFRQWRCYICPDHTGEFADIAVGDPWYRNVEPGEPGKSLIVARTARGKEFIERASKAGYITLETQNNALLPRSQPNLMQTRGSIWARLLVLRLLGAPYPQYRGFRFFRFWLRELKCVAKLKSFSSVLKRVSSKKLLNRVDVREG